MLLGILFLDKFALNFFVDFDAAQAATGLGEAVRHVQHWGFRFAVTFAAALALFLAAAGGRGVAAVNNEAVGAPVRLRWLGLHVVCFAALAVLSYYLYGRSAPLPFPVILGLWLITATLAVGSLFAALAPGEVWRRAARAIGVLWIYAGVAGVLAASAMQLTQRLWLPTAAITFELVRRVLGPLIPSLHADLAHYTLITDRFAVQVSDVCSGLEGVGLMLVFCGAWLLLFRREYRFPRALWLVPIGMAVIFVLNVIRIAALMLIGDAGWPGVAAYGFHSQAGWIAFNVAAGALAFLSRRSAWFCRQPVMAAPGTHNPTAAYLMPLLSILAVGMISKASSAGFERFYGARFVVAAVVLWIYRGALREVPWRASWRGVLLGVLVLLGWIALAQWWLAPTSMPAPLAQMSAMHRTAWIALRALAAILTVPIAEELAYRGFLMRRLQANDFEGLAFKHVHLLPLALSALAFGAAHGSLWIPGTVAGFAYGWLAIRTGRLGEAVAAHATSNALLAVYVLTTGNWQLW